MSQYFFNGPGDHGNRKEYVELPTKRCFFTRLNFAPLFEKMSSGIDFERAQTGVQNVKKPTSKTKYPD